VEANSWLSNSKIDFDSEIEVINLEFNDANES